MKAKNIKLWAKLFILIFCVSMTMFSFFYYTTSKEIQQIIEREEKTFIVQNAKQVASLPTVVDSLRQNSTSEQLKTEIESIRSTHQFDFIVVMNMDGIRLTHPNPNKIYKRFQGGDEKNSLLFGKITTSFGKGSLGKSLRGFVPVFDENHQQIGVVAIGVTLSSLNLTRNQFMKSLTLSFLISLLLAALLSSLLAFLLKKQMQDLDSIQIAQLLEERNAMLDYTKDAIFVTNLEGQIQLANQAAKKMLYPYSKTNSDSLIGQKIEIILPIPEVDKAQKRVAQEKIIPLADKEFLLSSAPIIVKNKLKGYLYFLRDASELLLLTEQLFATSAYANTIQSQSHDFINKLHIIYGLADLGSYTELNNYLENLLHNEQIFADNLIFLVKEPLIAAFLIGEKSKFSEKGIQLNLEILSEIPISDPKTVQQTIKLFRFIHQHIMNLSLPNQLEVYLDYKYNQLSLTYGLANRLQLIDTLQDNLFYQHLESNISVNSRTTYSNCYSITFTFDYNERTEYDV